MKYIKQSKKIWQFNNNCLGVHTVYEHINSTPGNSALPILCPVKAFMLPAIVCTFTSHPSLSQACSPGSSFFLSAFHLHHNLLYCFVLHIFWIFFFFDVMAFTSLLYVWLFLCLIKFYVLSVCHIWNPVFSCSAKTRHCPLIASPLCLHRPLHYYNFNHLPHSKPVFFLYTVSLYMLSPCWIIKSTYIGIKTSSWMFNIITHYCQSRRLPVCVCMAHTWLLPRPCLSQVYKIGQLWVIGTHSYWNKDVCSSSSHHWLNFCNLPCIVHKIHYIHITHTPT